MNKTYKIEQGKRVYAIGDIHGHVDPLHRLHDLIEADLKNRPVECATIVYVGDYVDRGPNSKGVLDALVERELTHPHFEHVFLLGNHEDAMFNEFMKDPCGHRQDWLQWGGVETLESYGVEVDRSKAYAPQAEDLAQALRATLPLTHQEFLKNLNLYHEVDDYLFVHAGIRPGVALEKQTKQDLTYTRDPFMAYEGPHSHRVVHGHTPPRNKRVDIRPNRINVDTHLYEGGPLSAAVIEGEDVRVLEVFHQS